MNYFFKTVLDLKVELEFWNFLVKKYKTTLLYFFNLLVEWTYITFIISLGTVSFKCVLQLMNLHIALRKVTENEIENIKVIHFSLFFIFNHTEQ